MIFYQVVNQNIKDHFINIQKLVFNNMVLISPHDRGQFHELVCALRPTFEMCVMMTKNIDHRRWSEKMSPQWRSFLVA